MKIGIIIFLIFICLMGFYLFSNPSILQDNAPEISNAIETIKNMFDNSFTQTNGNSYSPQANEISTYLKENNLNLIDINNENDFVLIKFSSDSFLDMDQLIYNTALEAYKIFQKPIKIEGYYLEEPFLALETNNPNDENSLQFIDIRNPEFMIENDLMIFDVLVEDININDNSILVELQYEGSENDFFNDFTAICFVIVQDAPQIYDISIKYLKNNLCLSMKTTSIEVLKFYDGEISMDQFLGNLKLEKCSSEKIDTHKLNNEQENQNLNDSKLNSQELTECPTGEELDSLSAQSQNRLFALMAAGKGDTPEGQEAYKVMKFYHDCYSTEVEEIEYPNEDES
ncbi:hypothetical protein KO317_00025 [Candidatus Micrarchaeota archaeon]|nr:hypothetical protein [Candidatus Micrarchaeota archaeon]